MDSIDNIILARQQEQFNEIASDWGLQSKNRYLYNLQKLPWKQRVAARKGEKLLRRGTGLKFVRQSGDIARVAWPFVRHGIFQEHGVGRWRKKGSGKEKPMPWIVPTLDAMTPILADNLQKASLESLGLVINIKVNGLFDIQLNP
jgi:hypothetical protein